MSVRFVTAAIGWAGILLVGIGAGVIYLPAGLIAAGLLLYIDAFRGLKR